MVSRETSVLELAARISAAAGECDLPLGTEAATILGRHLELVLSANERVNLTAITSVEPAIWAHVIDSLLLGEHVSLGPDSVLADLGSGAGYPGIPLNVAFGARVTLVEARGKRASFLEETVRGLGLQGVDVVAERAEAFARTAPGSQQFVTARAVSELAALVELAAPLLREKGSLVAMKGDPSVEEFTRADVAASFCGLERRRVIRYTLPGPSPAPRAIVEYRKVAEPAVQLPRREGKAQKDPLVRP